MAFLTLAQLEAAFKKWGVPYAVIAGAATRSNGDSWGDGPIGTMFHHTANDASDGANVTLLRDGRAGLSGPLCQIGVGDDGGVDIIAMGRANHAGTGDPAVRDAVLRGNYGDRPGAPRYTQGESSGIGGNGLWVGAEVYYGLGNDPTAEPIQYRATLLAFAAIHDAKGWPATRMIGHKEWQRGKVDPAAIDMKDARADLAWLLSNGPSAAALWLLTGSKESDDMQPDDKVALTADQIKDFDLAGPITYRQLWLGTLYLRQSNRRLEASMAGLVAGQAVLLDVIKDLSDGGEVPTKEDLLALFGDKVEERLAKVRVVDTAETPGA